MAQMKLSVCIALALFGVLVAGQRWDGNRCNLSANELAKDYNKGMTETINRLVSRLSKHGTDSANIEAITGQSNEIMSNLSQFVDAENMTDLNKLMGISQQTLQSYMKLGVTVFKTQTVTEAMKIYSEFGSSSARLYTDFITKLLEACGPSTRCGQ